MEILVLDNNYTILGLLEQMESLIWDERYYEAGAFEIYCPASKNARRLLREGNRVMRINKSEMVCVIDTVSEKTEDGVVMLTVSGRDVLYLTNRRIAAYRKLSEVLVGTAVQRILNDNVLNPTNAARTLPGIRYVASDINEAYITGIYQGESVHEILSGMCKQTDTGIKAMLNRSDKTIEISLYNGKNLMENQPGVNSVILSTDYGTLDEAEWNRTYTGYANTAYVGGDGSGKNRTVVLTGNTYRGEDRYEMFVSADGTRQDDETSAEEYNESLRNIGREELSKISARQTFEATMNQSVYKYRKDYNLGDLVSVRTDGIHAVARVIEAVETFDGNGETLDHTLEIFGWWHSDASPDAFLLDEYDEILTDENGEVLEDE